MSREHQRASGSPTASQTAEQTLPLEVNEATTDEAGRRQHAFVVSRSIVDYRAPLSYREEPVDVHVRVVACRGARLELAYEIRDADHLYAEATTLMAAYNLETGRPRRISQAELDFLACYTES
ncbi:acyl-CoA thioesterase [Streptomyces althioticus]|uniref:acyl-CoA thioesterase n=1 Tax=Streptomyces althioticus TaxID=83380 RepID=UPI0036EA592B